jgi:D-alanyl-D-alanine carboxypeptidase (penicillin-binding protein 5/6)
VTRRAEAGRVRAPGNGVRRPSSAWARALLVAVVLLIGLVPEIGRAQSGPPPTPVPLPGGGTSPSPFPQVLRTPEASSAPPELDAAAAVLADLDSGQILYDLNGGERRPIASLTKIMTAAVVLQRSSPTDVVTVSEVAASPRIAGISGLGLAAGERIRVDELVYALMLQSANDAAEALAEHVAGSVDAFVSLMNRRAEALGLRRTRFASPNGLDDTGYSTARDLARLTRAAYRSRGFSSIVATRLHTITAPDSAPRTVQNRNVLLWLYPGALGVKTGYTSEAGFCVVATAERDGERRIVVILGEPGEPFSDAAALLNYGFDAFERRPLVRAGEQMPAVDVDGRTVSVVAGASLTGLVPAAERVQRVNVPDERIPYPPPRGQAIGVVQVTAGGRSFGEVPLVVAGVPPPPPPEEGSWWSRAVGSVLEAGTGVLEALFG